MGRNLRKLTLQALVVFFIAGSVVYLTLTLPQKYNNQLRLDSIWTVRATDNSLITDTKNQFGLPKQRQLKYVPDAIVDYVYSKIQPESVDWSNYAYGTYANDVNLLCGAMMNFRTVSQGSNARLVLYYNADWDKLEISEQEEINQLKKGHQLTDNIALVTMLVSAANDYGVTLIPVEAAKISDSNHMKVLFFSMVQFERVIYFDSNSIFTQANVDELYFLPPSHVAMAQEYWTQPENLDFSRSTVYKDLVRSVTGTERQELLNLALYEINGSAPVQFYKKTYINLPTYVFTDNKNFRWSSALMVIKPSETIHTQLSQHLSQLEPSKDVINEFFALDNILINDHGSDDDQHNTQKETETAKRETDPSPSDHEFRSPASLHYKLPKVGESRNGSLAKPEQPKPLLFHKIPLVTIFSHTRYAMASDEYLKQDHAQYFADTPDLPFIAKDSTTAYWNQQLGEPARVVIFNNEKPWLALSHEDIAAKKKQCQDSDGDCSLMDKYLAMYQLFAESRLQACHLKLE